MKQALKDLIANGRTQQAIKQLLAIGEQTEDSEWEKEVLQQSARYNEYAKGQRLGTTSFEQKDISLAQINQALLELIDQLSDDEETVSIISSAQQKVVKKENNLWKYITGTAVIIGIFGSLAEILNFINIIPNSSSGTGQITVYVHGDKGKQDYILENEGELLIDLDGDRRYAKIGEKGRTVFNEVPLRFKDTVLPIFVKAKGYEPAKPNLTYKWKEKAIYYPVQSDRALLEIKGIVKNEDGTTFLSEVLIMIDNEWTTTTDSIGRFSYSINSKYLKEKYSLSLKKEGYQPLTEYYYPQSSKEFRLSKK